MQAPDSSPSAEKLQALELLLESMTEVVPPPPSAIRLLIEPQPLSGPRNMAVDEALLESVAAGAPATFRVYAWSEATISLGYFQRETPEIEPGGRFHGLAAVRRLSGGGAILHHREITYSCCVPGSHPLASDPTQLYDQIHRVICDTLAGFGATLIPRGEHEGDDKPFLCYARGDRRDLVFNGFKIVGSAQRRRHRAVLQHGSILLRRSPFLPEFPGLLDLARIDLDEHRLRHRLARNAGRILGNHPIESTLTAAELALALQLEREKYHEFLPATATGDAER